MASIGSVFLGDVQRHRLLSNTPPSTSPPSSPPAAAVFPSALASGGSAPDNEKERDIRTVAERGEGEGKVQRHEIDPELALDLRLRWLEAILVGVKAEVGGGRKGQKGSEAQTQTRTQTQTLCRLAENVQRRLDSVVEGNEGVKRFMAQYDQHAHLLTPTFALSLSDAAAPPSYSTMSPEEVDALLAEMEQDIRAAERDVREIQVLEGRGVTGAGRLAEHDSLKPRLRALVETQRENAERVEKLERRVVGIVERHAAHVDTLSDLFVEWDDALSAAEDGILKLERERDERRRLGLEAEA